MGIAAAPKAAYENAIRKLFPRGDYWDGQFADPESDASLFVKAKADELIRFRCRMDDLLAEGKYETASETIGGWERVFLGAVNAQLPLGERRRVIGFKGLKNISRKIIAGIAQQHGLALVDIVFPFKPSFFGFSEFGRSVFSHGVFFSVFYIVAAFHDWALKDEANKRKAQLLSRSSFGQGCFGTGQFLGRSHFNRHYAGRAFTGMGALGGFERDVNGKLLSGSIAYFQYKF